MNQKPDFKTYTFQDLTTHQLYEILKLRSEIFVVEQTCIYLDIDGKDLAALHLVGSINNQIIAYSRIFDQGIVYPEYAAIGRVVVHQEYRHQKIGDLLIQESIAALENRFKNKHIKIAAQEHLENFYSCHGFLKIGERYLDDGIWHIDMIKK